MSEIKKIILHTLRLESEIISEVAKNNIEEIKQAVDLIANASGRVIVSGVGKSAIVAQKMTATLNSTGTKALFMHGADAVHGDLGMLQKEDILIYISKSGFSTELDLLIPAIKSIKVKLISIVSNKESTLYRNSDCNILVPIEEEADPNNLAPTVSTIAQIAIGDAISIALMSAKSFTPHDFALYHPGGNLGKQMNLTVEQVFDEGRVPSASAESNVRDIIFKITESRQGACAILAEGDIIGIITDGDIRRAFGTHDSVLHLRASQIMRSNPKTIQKNAKAMEAFQTMKSHKISQLIVVDGERYCGLVHLHDLIREGFN